MPYLDICVIYLHLLQSTLKFVIALYVFSQLDLGLLPSFVPHSNNLFSFIITISYILTNTILLFLIIDHIA